MMVVIVDILSAWWFISIYWHTGSCQSTGQNPRSSPWGLISCIFSWYSGVLSKPWLLPSSKIACCIPIDCKISFLNCVCFYHIKSAVVWGSAVFSPHMVQKFYCKDSSSLLLVVIYFTFCIQNFLIFTFFAKFCLFSLFFFHFRRYSAVVENNGRRMYGCYSNRHRALLHGYYGKKNSSTN